MKFSVVGLPHYTIWHLYEPSVDDIRHMEQMEAERKAREEADRKTAEKLSKVGTLFDESNKNEYQADNEGHAHQKDKEADAAQGKDAAKGATPADGEQAVQAEQPDGKHVAKADNAEEDAAEKKL